MQALDGETCPVCLNPLVEDTAASVDNCQHVFCLACILQWSKMANICPVDRIPFTSIRPGGDVGKKIKVMVVKNDDEEEGASGIIVCEQCGRSDGTRQLLVCIHCDSGYHHGCLRAASLTSPQGDWTCPDCHILSHQAERLAEEEEISDGELSDLLAEVHEEASTSNRLRPTTINQSRLAAAPRRSPRNHTTTSSSSLSAHWHVPKHLLRATRQWQSQMHFPSPPLGDQK
ncbi:PHD and RING finger domain-containing protein 1-like [Dunckerocampus dactyliophorus]|uniref:PHD and RING finger domain-containing protein 1-like n=1 Tax=Dunckerocampus dactyliophorus TaxID=161453 RepID=UPI002405BFE0|nr:PHD and RING finger domain-containing protein 1-like [Dunckerocampus dactyliophorus]